MIKTKLDGQVATEAFLNQVAAVFFDAWVIMLAAGGLSHELAAPRLAIGYGTAILINIIAIALLIQPHGLHARLKGLSKQVEELQAKI